RLPVALSRVDRIARFIEDLSFVVDRQQQIDMSPEEKSALQASFLSARNSLASLRQTLISARTSIETAKERLIQAQIAATNGTVSAADAQVKQALGTLRAAQAQYAKTIIRTPIAGTVNRIDVKAGDFVTAFTPIATIANNNALTITV